MEVLEKIHLTDQQIEQIEAGFAVTIPATEDEFLEFAFETPYRVEYHDNYVIIMGLAKIFHELLVGFFITLLTNYYRNNRTNFYVGGSNSGVKLIGSKNYYNPDVLVFNGLPQFYQDSDSIITNPYLVVEVLSPSTRSYDLDVKLNQYLKIESLRFLVFVDIDDKVVMVYERSKNARSWIYTHYDSPEEAVNIDGCEFILHDVFDSLPKL
ncbi:MAG: Uma2 family endonuclease [Arcicella sp.]|jgi:Uma2 family endonuclease|nr:Uma2 family endonuclease [Arcicella sp.]